MYSVPAYFSSIQTNRSLHFLDDRSPQHPFFMMLSPPAPHSPWTAAPQYQKEFSDVKAPRGGSFDKPGKVCSRWSNICWYIWQFLMLFTNQYVSLCFRTNTGCCVSLSAPCPKPPSPSWIMRIGRGTARQIWFRLKVVFKLIFMMSYLVSQFPYYKSLFSLFFPQYFSHLRMFFHWLESKKRIGTYIVVLQNHSYIIELFNKKNTWKGNYF